MIIPEVHDTTFLEFGTTSSLDSNSRIVEEEVVFDDVALRRSDLKCGTRLFKEAGTDSNFLFLVSTTRSKMSPSAHVFARSSMREVALQSGLKKAWRRTMLHL